MSTITIKTVLSKNGSDDIRRFSLQQSGGSHYAELTQFLITAYGPGRYAVRYNDDDGDLCSISNELELSEAIRLHAHGARTLKLFVERSDELPSAAPSLNTTPAHSIEREVHAEAAPVLELLSELADLSDGSYSFSSDEEYEKIELDSERNGSPLVIQKITVESSPVNDAITPASDVSPLTPTEIVEQKEAAPVVAVSEVVAEVLPASMASPSAVVVACEPVVIVPVADTPLTGSTPSSLTSSAALTSEPPSIAASADISVTNSAFVNAMDNLVTRLNAGDAENNMNAVVNQFLGDLSLNDTSDVKPKQVAVEEQHATAATPAYPAVTVEDEKEEPVQAEFAAAAAPVVPDNTWACEKCTFLNRDGDRSCTICDAKRPVPIPTAQPVGSGPVPITFDNLGLGPVADIINSFIGVMSPLAASPSAAAPEPACHKSACPAVPALPVATLKQPEAQPTASCSAAPSNEAAVHAGVSCDACGAEPIRGDRYKCTQCHNFDLCSACEAAGKTAGTHRAEHVMMKICKPVQSRCPFRRPIVPNTENNVHYHVTCDNCHAHPIVGIRYKCSNAACPDLDLCEKCEAANVTIGSHTADHVMMKIRKPISAHAGQSLYQRVSRVLSHTRCFPQSGFAGHIGRLFGRGFHHRCRPHAHNEQNSSNAAGAAIERPSAVFEGDVTLPDGVKVRPGEKLHKVWSLRNSGATAWPAGTRLEFTGGEVSFADQDSEDARGNAVLVPAAAPGAVVHVAIDLIAPDTLGRCRATFRLSTADGVKFGPRFWLDILVVPDDSKKETTAAPAPAAAAPVSVSPAAPASEVPVMAQSITEFKYDPQVPAAAAPAVPAAAPVIIPAAAAYRFDAELQQLLAMGFSDATFNKILLDKYNGSVNQVVAYLLNSSSASAQH